MIICDTDEIAEKVVSAFIFCSYKRVRNKFHEFISSKVMNNLICGRGTIGNGCLLEEGKSKNFSGVATGAMPALS